MTRFVILAALIAVLACPAWADPKVDPSELPPVERIDSSVQAIRGQLKNVQSKLRHGVGDLSKPADGSLVKSRQKPVGS